ncbi:hypothetical protein SAMN05428945_5336 [Streptomyces sp. 2224.1]|nr:hypothetical protein SAMN05428945_5336 [Streptomyces sp. 2224.1]
MGDTAVIPLTLLPGRSDTTRIGRDRLELLTALIDAPAFDPLFRDTLIFIPPQHPVFACSAASTVVSASAASATTCAVLTVWSGSRQSGPASPSALSCTPQRLFRLRGEWTTGAAGSAPDRPAVSPTTQLCHQHQNRWQYGSAARIDRKHLGRWALAQHALPGFGLCKARCPFWPAARWDCASSTRPATKPSSVREEPGRNASTAASQTDARSL